MLTNKDEDIRTLIEASIESEKAKRKIDTELIVQNQIFLNWKTTDDGKSHKGTNSIVQRARNALAILDLKLCKLDNTCYDEDQDENIVTQNTVSSFKLTDSTTGNDFTFNSFLFSLLLKEGKGGNFYYKNNQCICILFILWIITLYPQNSLLSRNSL